MNTTAPPIVRAVILSIVVLALWTAAMSPLASAEPPIYEPYGAWRGRIRYVEGPRRVRTHIRWSNGITPVGGQVLMHLATVAGNVATNENFLNAVTGRDAEIDANLVRDVAAVNTTNAEMLTRLNKLRGNLQLSPVVFKSTTSTDSPAPEEISPGAPNPNVLLGPWEDSKTAVEQRRKELRTSVASMAATEDSVFGTAEAEKMRRGLLKDFLTKAVLADVAPHQSPVAPAALPAFINGIRELDVEITSFIEVLDLAGKNGTKLLNASTTPDPERNKVLQATIDAYKKYLDELKALQSALKM